jgi:hypothetical protein
MTEHQSEIEEIIHVWDDNDDMLARCRQTACFIVHAVQFFFAATVVFRPFGRVSSVSDPDDDFPFCAQRVVVAAAVC